MNTIVMNTRNAAVTEYDWLLTGISATRGANASALFTLGGTDDDGEAIAARAVPPATDMGSSVRKRLGDVMLSVKGPQGSSGQLIVQQHTYDAAQTLVVEEYAYPFVLRPAGVHRATPGKGIRANRLAIGYANVNGADFVLNKLEPDVIESPEGRRLA